MAIITIVFDFGNVLGFFSHQKAAEKLCAFTHMAPAEITAAYVDTDLEDEFEKGSIGPADFRRQLRQLCHLRCTDEEFDLAAGDIFWPNAEVCDLVPLLKQRFRLLLLSNTNAIHAAQFQRQFAGTLAHFDHLVLSHEVRMRKPDPRIFHHARELANAPAEQCLFIDDLPANIEGARACGMQGLVYIPGEDVRLRLASAGVEIDENGRG